jgi:hypothetical protein
MGVEAWINDRSDGRQLPIKRQRDFEAIAGVEWREFEEVEVL